MERKKFEQLKERIYEYCDNNIGLKTLFTGFTFLSPLDEFKGESDYLTSGIVDNLVKQRVLKEIPFRRDFFIAHGMYKILLHKKLTNK